MFERLELIEIKKGFMGSVGNHGRGIMAFSEA